MIGHLVACYGAADRYLGMLAATLGEHDRAEEHFEAALRAQPAHGRRTWLAHTRLRARAHAAGPRAGDASAAPAAARRGRDARRGASGCAALLGRVRAPGRRAARAAALPDGLSPREVQILGARRRGLSNREIGAALSHQRAHRRPTTCAASCARPAARTAPRPRPTPTATASSTA